jgi:hypothetical protein
MDCKFQLLIPHLLERDPNFNQFIEEYLHIGNDSLEDHSQAKQFELYMGSNGWPLMQYKICCIDIEWLLKEVEGICL